MPDAGDGAGHEKRRSSAQGERRQWGKLRDVKRPACLERQTGACRRCGPAAYQPCRGHEEPVETTDLSATDRRTPTDWWRTGRRERSVLRVQRRERSLPTGRLVPNGRSDQPRPSGGCPAEEAINFDSPDGCPATEAINSDSPDRCPTGEGLITPTAGLDRGRRTSVNSVVSARAACEGLITPLRQHSLVGDRGRANHPPVMPVQQGSRTQVSMVGTLEKA